MSNHALAREAPFDSSQMLPPCSSVMLNGDGSDLQWAAPDVHEEHQPDWAYAPLQ